MSMLRCIFSMLVTLLLLGTTFTPVAASEGSSLRFFGSGPNDIDRVKIPLGSISDGQIIDSLPVNVGGDFTIEFWIRATPGANNAPACEDRGWYYGNIIIDRDVDGPGDYGDYGVAICDGRLAFGVAVGDEERMIFGTTSVVTGQWHHVAVTRADGGAIAIFVDGRLDAQGPGPVGRIDYRTNRPSEQPNSDPYLVLGAEKHDYEGSAYYYGWLADLHISNQVRYMSDFVRPSGPHQPDGATVALYRFDEGSGTVINDSSGAPGGPSHGILMIGGDENGTRWSDDNPFRQVEEHEQEPPPLPEVDAELPSEPVDDEALDEPLTPIALAPTPLAPLQPVDPDLAPVDTEPTALNQTTVPDEVLLEAPAIITLPTVIPPNQIANTPPPSASGTTAVFLALGITVLLLGMAVFGVMFWRAKN
ncbi:LamG domain-containing protein [Candidatus Viridilinea mediisalina]|uniref:LamG-like jellyroll fold domain-containing protein n=1 Tax=Candidatus Viridilinea mediisalina TaxID=2024553 RepID=A0A2A6REK3_9CHLR|nr:LamG domain-containing protein [Candidatus Viridilinea mediisalina]PDW01026.1 hypothetical protein CJ255_19755 [Candidatus Viridilinea mediisalina]